MIRAMSIRFRILITMVIIAVAFPLVHASPIQSDVRALALGETYAGDVGSNFVLNPSSLTSNNMTKLNLNYYSVPHLDLVSNTVALKYRSLGIANSRFMVKDVAGENYVDNKMSISYGKELLKDLIFGLGYRLDYINWGESKKQNQGLTFSIVKQGPRMNLGMVISDLLLSRNNMDIRCGLNFRFNNSSLLNVELDNDKKYYIGYEHSLMNNLKVRLGTNSSSYSLGCGIESELLNFDYAYVMNELSYLHRMGITVVF